MVPKRRVVISPCDLMLLPLSAHVCLGLVVDYWSFVSACTHHSYYKLYYLCNFASLFKLLPTPTLLCAPPTHPLIYICPIVMIFMKKSAKSDENQPLSTCQVSFKVLLYSVNEFNTKARLCFN